VSYFAESYLHRYANGGNDVVPPPYLGDDIAGPPTVGRVENFNGKAAGVSAPTAPQVFDRTDQAWGAGSCGCCYADDGCQRLRTAGVNDIAEFSTESPRPQAIVTPWIGRPTRRAADIAAYVFLA
jgi:hypothetical protein